MTAAIVKFFGGLLSACNFTGPVLAKELRVSARRRRNYVLRAGYIAALLAFVSLIWVSEIGRRLDYAEQEGGVRVVERMAEAGKQVVLCIIWFQFIAAQLIAVIVASAAISEEARNRTLGVLMTTPINSFQIVMGKVLSKLLQVLVLLAMSLPLLAWVRIFGGVPWDYVLSSLCITICAVVFAGSLSMFFSIFSRRAYVVILETLAAFAFLYAFVPWVLFTVMRLFPYPNAVGVSGFRVFMANTNPFVGMAYSTDAMVSPRWAGRSGFFEWPILCAVLLGMAAIVLIFCCGFVRRVARRQAAGGPGKSAPDVPEVIMLMPPGMAAAPFLGNDHAYLRIREVRGSPILWKELRTGLFRRKLWLFIVGGATMVLLLITYAICAADHQMQRRDTHAVYATVLMLLGMLVTGVVAATPITSEKEARSWALLLLTGLSDWHILLAKAAGVIRRCAIVWAPLGFHLVLFAMLSMIHPVAIFQIALIVGWTVLFLTASGLFFSTIFRKTTTAVIMNLLLGVILWLALPFATYSLERMWQAEEYNTATTLEANPVVQLVVVAEATCGEINASYFVGRLSYDWPGQRRYRYMRYSMQGYPGYTPPWEEKAGGATKIIILWGAAYMVLGVFLLAIAKARLRKNPG